MGTEGRILTMVDITLICVGKMKEKFYSEAAAEYMKRLEIGRAHV